MITSQPGPGPVRGVVEPVEDVRHLEGGLHAVSLGVAPGRLDGVRGAVEAEHPRGPGLGGVDRERALVAEGVEDPLARAVPRDRGVLGALVEVEARSSGRPRGRARRQTRRSPPTAAPRRRPERVWVSSGRPSSLRIWASLRKTTSAGCRMRSSRSPIRADLLLHRERLELHDHGVAVLVGDDAGEVVRLRPHEPPEFARRPARDRPLEGAPEVGLVQGHAVAVEPAPHDLGAAVADARPEEPARAVAALHDLPVAFGGQRGLDLVGEHPGMPREHPRVGVGLELVGGSRHPAIIAAPAAAEKPKIEGTSPRKCFQAGAGGV